MNKRIAIFTTTRGDMAIIAPLIKTLKKDQNITLYFFVGGTHDKKTYGETVKEIGDLNIKIDGYFNSRNSYNNDDPLSLSILLSKDQIKLANIFKVNNFEYVCLVGDRYEKMAIVMNAILFKKKIIHIHGGEITLGSFDNQIRNMFSNASELHFVICDKYKKNLINMNIDKKKIHNIGSLAIENLVSLKKTSASQVLEKFNLNKKNFCILNYHPPSLDIKIKFENQITNILKALTQFGNQVLITTPGLDSGRNDVIKVINKKKKKK